MSVDPPLAALLKLMASSMLGITTGGVFIVLCGFAACDPKVEKLAARTDGGAAGEGPVPVGEAGAGLAGDDISGGGGAPTTTGVGGSKANGGTTGFGSQSNAGAGSISAGGRANPAGGTAATGGSSGTSLVACDDGLDNDQDGYVDSDDPECTGASDADEATFAVYPPGDNVDPKWQDCFFDDNSAAGDDTCHYANACLHGSLPQDDADCQVSATCIAACAPQTPPGCDCFGCCTMALDADTSADIELSATCSSEQLADTVACPRCVKSNQCSN